MTIRHLKARSILVVVRGNVATDATRSFATGVTAEVAYTLSDVRKALFPFGVVLDGNVAIEALSFQFIEHPPDVTDA